MSRREYFKVLRNDLTSLGLRRVPRIQYTVGCWTYGSNGHGLWVAKRESDATKLKKYFENKYNVCATIFLSLIDKILYESSCRIETNRVMLLRELL